MFEIVSNIGIKGNFLNQKKSRKQKPVSNINLNDEVLDIYLIKPVTR